MHFPVSPLHCIQLVRNESRDTDTIGCILFAEEKIKLVHTIYWPVFWNFCPANTCQRCVSVNYVNHFIVIPTRRHFTRPPYNEGCPQRSFHGSEVGSSPGSAISLPGMSSFRTV